MRVFNPCGVLPLGLVGLILLASHVHAQVDSNDDYVRQVLEEERQYYADEDYYAYYDEYNASADNDDQAHAQQNQQQQQTEAERLQAEQELQAREEADRLAAQREKQFQAELDRMNEEQRKAALKQKRKDHRRVQAVLKAAQHNDLYSVLGLRNWNLKIPPRKIRITGLASWGLTIPGVTLKETTEKDIRRQFRTMSKLVHPDKNKDGRASEAFIAVETAATILSDPHQRAMYDEERRLQREERMDAGKLVVSTTVRSVWQVSGHLVKTGRSILGPFATPVFILAFLIA